VQDDGFVPEGLVPRKRQLTSRAENAMRKPPLDPKFSDLAPTEDTLTDYDNYPCSQHVSCAGGQVQRVDSLNRFAKRGDETGSDFLVGRDAAVPTRGVSFQTIIFEY
jgi:hypothetical protein